VKAARSVLRGRLRSNARLLPDFKHGSINAMADRLDIAQAGIGRQIKQLEQELGVRLFERGARGRGMVPGGQGRGMIPTETARVIYDYYCQFRGQQEKMRAVLQEMQEMKRGMIRILVPSMFVNILVKEMLNTFCAKYPQLQVD